MFLLQSGTNSIPQPFLPKFTVSFSVWEFSWLKAKKLCAWGKNDLCVFLCVFMCVCVCCGAVKSRSHWHRLYHFRLANREGWRHRLESSFSPFDSSKSGTSLAVFPKDSHGCLYPLPQMISSSSSLTLLSIIPTHPYPFPRLLVHDEWGNHVFGVYVRDFPGSQCICSYLYSPSGKGRGGALSLPLCLFLASLPFHWSPIVPLGGVYWPAPPLSLFLSQMQLPWQQGGEALQTLTLSAWEERAGGLEDQDISSTSILFPLSSSRGDLCFGIKTKVTLWGGGLFRWMTGIFANETSILWGFLKVI